MREYRKVVEFKYSNKKYVMLLDNQDKYFFMSVDSNGKYNYITIEELVELGILFSNSPQLMNIERGNSSKKMKLIPKILIGGVLTTLTLASTIVLPSVVRVVQAQRRYESNNRIIQEQVVDPVGINTKLSFEIVDSEEDLVLDTTFDSVLHDSKYIYDMEYLDEILNYDSVELQDFYNVIDNNDNISNKFKNIVKDYCKDFIEKYPNAERRALYENLKTIEFVECNDIELVSATWSIDSYACYVRNENKIYVHEDYEYKEGTWDYQVMYHEISHAARTAYIDYNGTLLKVQCEGTNFSTLTAAEALNSLFAVSLFDYSERDIAYQLQSNYFGIILESIDNYTLEDYINHSLSYLPYKLDEFMGHNNYAQCMLEVIEAQYDDFHSDDIEIEQKEFYPLYEYISDIYYKSRITADMSYDEAKIVTDELIEKIMFDVPEEYNINGANSEVYARMKQLSKEVRETSNYLKNYVIPEISDAIDYEYDRIRRKEAELAAGSSN